MQRIAEQLDKAGRLLAEVYGIGVWVTSDDCSDNRRRRQLLREVDWALSDALRSVAALQPGPAVDALRRDLETLVGVVEPLPDTISDIFDDTRALDVTVSDLAERVTAIRERVDQLRG